VVPCLQRSSLSSHYKWCVFPSAFKSYLLTLKDCSPDKTIKLWKVYDKAPYEKPPRTPAATNGKLTLPTIRRSREKQKTAVPRKTYANAHAYHINSISLNTDGETYISADDLRINLWNLEISDQSFSNYFLLSGFSGFSLTIRKFRRCGYKARQHGRVDRGHHSCGVSSGELSVPYVQQQ